MSILLSLLVLIIVFGVCFWVLTLIPLPPPFAVAARVILAIAFLIVLLGFVGWVPGWRFHHL